MKTLKNDTRYIIKRVLIGVLIAILLFNAQKCGVYAETKDIYVRTYLTQSASSDNVTLTTLASNVDTSFNFCNASVNDINFHFYFPNSSNATISYNDCYVFLFQNPNNLNEYSLQIIPFDRGNLIFSAITSNSFLSFEGTYTPTNTSGTFSTPPNYYLNNLDTNFGVNSKSNIYNQNDIKMTTYAGYVLFNINNVNDNYQNFSVRYPSLTRWKSEYYNIITTWTLYSNSEVPIKIYDENRFEPAPLFPPTGYGELDLTGYQGVVFVPKNYDNMNCSEVGDLCNTTFDYYYQEEIKEAYFPLDNHFDLRFNSDLLISNGQPSDLKSSYYPLYQISNEEKYYYSFMIYNYTNNGTPLDPNNYYAYGSSKVWYDSTLYDYYLVDDFNTWSANICYIADNTQKCIDVSGLPTLREAIEQAEQEELINSFAPQSNNVILEFLKTPFIFLRRLSPDKCIYFELPIPFVNSNIRINCLSDTFKNVLGNNYNYISIFINGIFLYYITLLNIRTFRETLDPQNDKLEEVDL